MLLLVALLEEIALRGIAPPYLKKRWDEHGEFGSDLVHLWQHRFYDFNVHSCEATSGKITGLPSSSLLATVNLNGSRLSGG